MSKANFRYVNSRENYLKFLSTLVDDFGGIESLVQYIGIDLAANEDEYIERIEDYKGAIGIEPDTYPAVVYYLCEENADRLGKYTVRIFDFVTFDELGLKIDNEKFDDSSYIDNKKGRWIIEGDVSKHDLTIKCSNCGHLLDLELFGVDECPNCKCEIDY